MMGTKRTKDKGYDRDKGQSERRRRKTEGTKDEDDKG